MPTWVDPAGAVIGLGAVMALVLSTRAASDLPVWALVVVGALFVASWLLWRVTSPLLGRMTAAAAVGAGAFLVAGVLVLLPGRCPVTEAEGRCSITDAAAGGLLGMTGALAVSAVSVAAVAVATMLLRAGRLSGRGASAAAASIVSAEAARRRRRESGVRWLTWSVHDVVLRSSLVGAVLGAAVAALLWRDAWSVLAWALGGALVLGGVPAAWRAGTRARELRARSGSRRRSGRGHR